MQRRQFLKIAAAGTAAMTLTGPAMAMARKNNKRPNVVLIMGDDIGFGDLGCFGSEIETPNLDRLGHGGVRFTQFYNMAKCNPTRSSMLTGLFLGNDNSQSLGSLMGRAGYTTLTSGKQHFDTWVPDRCSADLSFDKSFTHFGGAGPFFEHNAITFHLNGKKLAFEEIENETEPYYKTNAITDYALRFLEDTKDDGKPFFLYLPYESAHYPLHALPEDIAKFRGRYKQGWDKLREKRFEKQKKLGFFDDTVTLSPSMGLGDKGVTMYRPWDTLTEKEKDDLDLEMSVFAAMVHCLDRNIGRVIKKLEQMGQLDNTLIMYLSDNGSCPFDRNQSDLPPGGPKSYRSLSAAWANLGNTPFRYFKQNGHEGGARTHFIAHWPDVIKPGTFCRQQGHLVDIMPTMLEMAGAEYPKTQDGQPTPQLDGSSLIPLFKGGKRKDPDILISGWTESKRMIRSGDWEIVTVSGQPWELYNLEDDPTELNNLAEKMPEKVQRLLKLYKDWRAARQGLPDNQKTKADKYKE
jgi:arylsulfatase